MPNLITEPTGANVRDRVKEQPWIDEFVKAYGRQPEGADWATIAQAAYSPEEMPDEFKALTGATQQRLGMLGIERGAAREEALGTEAGAKEAAAATGPAFDVLQEALRAKQGVAEAPIGPSKIFEKAGLTGYASLAQSLSTRRDEISTNFANYSNFIQGLYRETRYKNQQLIDSAEIALDRYNMLNDEYKEMADSLARIDTDAREYEYALRLYKEKSEVDKETYLFEQQHKVFAPREAKVGTALDIFQRKYGLSMDQLTETLYGETAPVWFKEKFPEKPDLWWKAGEPKAKSWTEFQAEATKAGITPEIEPPTVYKGAQWEVKLKATQELAEDVRGGIAWKKATELYDDLELKDIYQEFVKAGREKDIPSEVMSEILKIRALGF